MFFHVLEKQEAKPKHYRWEETLKIKVEINGIETKRKINQVKSSS